MKPRSRLIPKPGAPQLRRLVVAVAGVPLFAGLAAPPGANAAVGQQHGITRSDGVILMRDGEGGPPRPVAEGVLVWEVAAQSPAATAGVRVGDLIMRINDQRVRSERELHAALEDGARGQEITLDFMRGGRVGYSASIPAAGPAPSQARLAPGKYRCSAYNVSGGGGSCQTMPPLVIEPGGRYRFSSTAGRWRVENGKLILSEARIWGPGEILGPETIRFTYDYRGWRHTVTWTCQGCAREQQVSDRPAGAGRGSYVGVTLTLQFQEEVGGVATFAIVPIETASGYTHNGPLPPGAVQGLAWETDRHTVQLGTNRNNKLVSGRKYVVFLSWPAESIPVAVLDVPPVDEDYVATLPASWQRPVRL